MQRGYTIASWLGGFVLAVVACTARDGGTPATEIGCDEYLACLAEVDSQMFEDELPVYGNDGSCFDGSDAANCHTVCRNRLEAIESSAEACNPPEPEPGQGPTPEPNGRVSCDQIVSGPTVGPGEAGPTGFSENWCSPRMSGNGDWTCCSDDPAAEGGAPPNYVQKNISGGATPYFSGVNNDQSTSGMCVRTNDIPAGSGLLENEAFNCPIPCNPTWERDATDAVCGPSRVCCQTRELQAADCVQDESADGFRPVTGADIGSLTNWSAAEHATHQDPSGRSCSEAAIAAGADPASVQTSPVFLDCVAQLSVANQRGFCLALGVGQACPLDRPDYVDACASR